MGGAGDEAKWDNPGTEAEFLGNDDVKDIQLELWGSLEAADGRLNITDPNDKQWIIEMRAMTLEKKRLDIELTKEQSLIAFKEADKAQYEYESLRAKLKLAEIAPVAGRDKVNFESTCGFCDSKFSYHGDDNVACDSLYERFCEVHDPCGRR